MIWSCGCRLWTHLQVGRLLYWKRSVVKEAFLRDAKMMPTLTLRLCKLLADPPNLRNYYVWSSMQCISRNRNWMELKLVQSFMVLTFWSEGPILCIPLQALAVLLGQTSTKKNGNGKCRPLDTKSNEGFHQFSHEPWNCSSISCSEKTHIIIIILVIDK